MTTDSLSLARGFLPPLTAATLPSVDALVPSYLADDLSMALDDGALAYARDEDDFGNALFAVVYGCGGVVWRGASRAAAMLARFAEAARCFNADFDADEWRDALNASAPL